METLLLRFGGSSRTEPEKVIGSLQILKSWMKWDSQGERLRAAHFWTSNDHSFPIKTARPDRKG